MRVGIMQPYFLPYIGYFALIKHVDKFVILDDVQFIRHGWIERNRILKPTGGWQYISVPLQRHSQKTLIKDIIINNDVLWQERILAQLVHYKKAAYYDRIVGILTDIFQERYDTITELNIVAMKKITEYLRIDTPIQLFADMNLAIEPVSASDEWALNICRAMENVDEYWNPPGGVSFFDKTKYERNHIKLQFQQVEIVPYSQMNKEFEGGLSIVDVMMFNSVEEINGMLDRYFLL